MKYDDIYNFVQPKKQIAEYLNPILSGFHPDPSICRAGNDFYLVNSSFAYFPGLPLFTSSDMVNWRSIGHAMDRNTQLPLMDAAISEGLWAPTIRYHNGRFFITCTLVNRGANFVITATDPAGEWSDPVWLPNVEGIDPSLFFDDDGSAWLVYNSVAPEGNPEYDGHRTIRMRSFDPDSCTAGETETILVNGGTSIENKPVWIEGPHIYKRNDWYYLLCAEGGTYYEHSVVMFRSRSLSGPFESYQFNPVLTQRSLDKSRKNPVTSAGHADLIEVAENEWYAVLLACRPYRDDYYNTGRETFMVPVNWDDEWPVFNPGFADIQYRYPVPSIFTAQLVNPFNRKQPINQFTANQPANRFTANQPANPFTGNLIRREDFGSAAFSQEWLFLRNPIEPWLETDSITNEIRMRLRPGTCSEKGNPSFIGYRQKHLTCRASVRLRFSAANENEKAGLLIFQDERHFYFLCVSVENNLPVAGLYSVNDDGSLHLITSTPIESLKETRLVITANRDRHSFYIDSGHTQGAGSASEPSVLIASDVDATYLSTAVAGGFTGCVFALYASSHGRNSDSVATFSEFCYEGNDDVFN